jgi:predicted  nucleic acid-binding Zn-ribbon protein
MTQKEVLDALLAEIKHIKTHMPNGELKQMARDFESMKEDLSDLKYTLLNPENGVIVNTNRNTEYRKELENNEVDFRNKLMEIEDLKRWKEGVTRALWIIFGILATVVIRMILMHSEQG